MTRKKYGKQPYAATRYYRNRQQAARALIRAARLVSVVASAEGRIMAIRSAAGVPSTIKAAQIAAIIAGLPAALAAAGEYPV